GRDRLLVDALVLLSELDNAESRLAHLEEAVAIARRIGDLDLEVHLLEKAIGHADQGGGHLHAPDQGGGHPHAPGVHEDTPIVGALGAPAAPGAERGDRGGAADLRERAARASDADHERELLLEVAAMAAGPLADLGRAARLYEELRAREPAEREIW